jgi:lysophospholipase L1-like esterase
MANWFKPSVAIAIAVFLLCFGIIGQGVLIAAQRVDQLPSAVWWQAKVQQQILVTRNQTFSACLFGDSISSGLGNSLGAGTFNFAMGGLSSVSLVAQLQRLGEAGVQCQRAIVAIGTNDAMYSIEDANFVENMKVVTDRIRGMGANEVILIPAFYSTVEASYAPNRAGTLERVDEINHLIRQIAAEQRVGLAINLPKPLYRDRSLNEDLTFDGVHLNDEGKKIYRQLLLDLLKANQIAG